jgi:hypothetical protein
LSQLVALTASHALTQQLQAVLLQLKLLLQPGRSKGRQVTQ